MGSTKLFKDSLLDIDYQNFGEYALDLFQYQAKHNAIMHSFLYYANVSISKITTIADIPFLPIEFFKTHDVKTGQFEPESTFYSSGTTNSEQSKHHIRDLKLYDKSLLKGFQHFYGDPGNWAILALLPTYMDNPNASLIYMVDHLVKKSSYQESGFFMDEYQDLSQKLKDLKKRNIPTLLIGVSYALLALAEQYPMDLSGVTLMETGGMKGQRREIVREELHSILKKQFNLNTIHSEYGMTELLSQAYSKGDGIFQTPPWMEVFIRDPYDPFAVSSTGKGALNIVDLANIDSCAFIGTQDLGEKFDDGSFRVLGRFDDADVRGCNLLMV